MVCVAAAAGAAGMKGSSCFLKKRTKRLLSVALRSGPWREPPAEREIDKSFLVLFFKKELLPFLCFR
jgi:hypothetical protein